MKKILTHLLLVFISVQGFSQDGWDLEKCINHAIDHNVDIQAQRLQNELNVEDVNQARANAYPSLNANVSHGYNWGQRIDPFTNAFASERVRNNNLNLSADVTLFNGFRISKLKDQAQMSLEAGDHDLTQSANDISLQVAQAYLSNLLAKEQLRISESQRLLTEEQVERMRKLVDGGQEPKASLYELEAQLASDDWGIVRSQNDILTSKVALVNLLQLKGEEALNFELVSADNLDMDIVMPSLSADDLYRSAIATLPQVKAAQIREQQSALDVDVARSIALPRLSLSGSVGSGYSGANQESVGNGTSDYVPLGQVGIGGETVFSLSQQTFFDEFQTKSFGDQLDQNFNQSLGLNLSIPIFNNFSSKISVKRARINMELAKINSARVENQLSTETQQAHANAIAALNQYKSAEKSADVLTKNFDNAQKRFENGLINATEFNMAKTQMQNQQFQMVSAKYEYVFRMKIMELYTGSRITLK